MAESLHYVSDSALLRCVISIAGAVKAVQPAAEFVTATFAGCLILNCFLFAIAVGDSYCAGLNRPLYGPGSAGAALSSRSPLASAVIT